MTLRISGSLYVTSNSYLTEICDLGTRLRRWWNLKISLKRYIYIYLYKSTFTLWLYVIYNLLVYLCYMFDCFHLFI
jgi:hypothetical protein